MQCVQINFLSYFYEHSNNTRGIHNEDEYDKIFFLTIDVNRSSFLHPCAHIKVKIIIFSSTHSCRCVLM